MRYAGIDVASEKHFVAVISGEGEVLQKARPFVEDAEGYAELFKTLGGAGEVLVAMEATGHYWKNLFAALTAEGYRVAGINPLRAPRRISGGG